MTSDNPNAPEPLTAAGQIVADLARQHGIAYVKTRGGQFAETVTRLSGGEIETDAKENLLIALV